MMLSPTTRTWIGIEVGVFVLAALYIPSQPHRGWFKKPLITFTAPGDFPHDLRLELPSGTTAICIKPRPIPP
jgi:hypothetical protein